MTEDLNKRVIDLMTDLFNKAAEQSADADSITTMVEEVARDTIADAVEDAVTDKIGYSEVITEDNFNDWLEDADALNGLVREDYVDDAIMYAIDELESDSVSLATVNQMMRDLETDLEAAKLSNRIKVRVERLFTLTKAKLRSLASIRLSIRKG